MFENYSLADLWANLYKKKKINLIALVIVFLAISIPISYQAINSRSVVKSNTSYSSYIIYKITAPDKEFKTESNTKNDQYSNFYARLLTSNMNGAYLFNDSSDADVSKYAGEISSNTTQLRNSDADFWEKKITVNNLGDYTGVSVKVLTTSPSLNQLVEKKVDQLMNEYKNSFTDVSIQKLETVNSQEVGSSETTVSSFNIRRLVLQIIVVFFLAAAMIVFINFVAYLFNPTINRTGDFRKYGVDHIFEVENVQVLTELLRYKAKQVEDLTVITSNKKLAERLTASFEGLPLTFVDDSNFNYLNEQKYYLFVEEFGATRYIKFEKKLQELHNFDKEVIGVAVLPLSF